MKLLAGLSAVAMAASVCLASTVVQAQDQERPNILVIFGDDIGMYNIGAYNRGMLGGSTPNIDRIAEEGALFTDYYAQQSCTAGRAAFITGQNPIRTGLLTIGMPGDTQGLQASDPTIAELLKAARLRHRPVRQEPPRRPQRVPADRCTASTSSSATSTT